MDMKKKHLDPKQGRLSDLSKMNLVVGAKQLKKALLGGRAACVFLAENADPAVTEPIEAMCQNSGVTIHWVSSMTDLGRACGIEVGAAAAAVLNP